MTGERAFATVARQPGRVTATLAPDHAHALCAGHFPDDPLIPGSTLVGLAVDVAALLLNDDGGPRWQLSRMERATFTAPARPTARIDVIAVAPDHDRGAVSVHIHSDGTPVAQARLRFAVTP